MPVHVIEALPSVSVIPQAEQERRKLNAIGYARTSTTEQESSYESQLAYFEDLIKRNPDWNFCGMYSDESSGTTTKKRDGFNRMIQACEAGGVDIIVCKSLSRFSRNVVDAISQIRRLRELGVNLWLQKENVWTMEESGELLLVVLSSLAQAESQSISVNVSLGIRYKMQRGIPMINCSRFLGYDKNPVTKKLVINASEARVVRFIYRSFLEGFSLPEIGKKLREAHIPSGSGRTDWPTESIRYILSNEKYVGDLLMQKTYCPSFLTHKMVKNEGKLPQYFVSDNHDPIVPREIWHLTQRLLIQRGRTEGHPGQRKYALSGKVICGCCGTEYKRFAGARLLPAATTLPATQASTEGVDLGAANTLPTPSAVFPTTALPTSQLPSPVDTSTGGDVENSSPRNAGAVWKCKARVSRKDAAAAAARLFFTTTNPSSATPAADQACTPGSVATSTAGDGETIPTPSRDGTIWRCENRIVDEHTLELAVDRALALLPREEANIRLIQQECLRVLADSNPSSSAADRAAGACGEHSNATPSAAADDHSGEGDDRHTAAQILLLHTETALSFLHSTSPQSPMTASAQWVESSRDGGRDGLPCTTFQQFMERSSVWLPRIGEENGGGGAVDDCVDLLVEKVVVDGEKIRVRFKAGVEI